MQTCRKLFYIRRPQERIWFCSLPAWPDWVIYWTLGNFLKPLAAIILPKLSTFLGNVSKANLSFFKWTHFWATFIFTFGDFFWSHCSLLLSFIAFGVSLLFFLHDALKRSFIIYDIYSPKRDSKRLTWHYCLSLVYYTKREGTLDTSLYTKEFVNVLVIGSMCLWIEPTVTRAKVVSSSLNCQYVHFS